MAEIYLDNNATTRVLPSVTEALLPYLQEHYGNPGSLHRLGVNAGRALGEAREAVADALQCQPREVIFTSGGTEANNLAIRGAVAAMRRRGNHVVTTVVEHPSVREVCRALEAEGLRVTYVEVSGEGRLDPRNVIDAVEDDTILVSVMHVQNEIGSQFPIEALADRVKRRRKGVLFHSDGVQAFGKLSPPGPAVDLYSISGHKIHAPKGVGALLVRRGVRIQPILSGGGQERGLRSGTEPVPGIVGLGAAARLWVTSRADWANRARRLGDRLREGMVALGAVINSPSDAVSWTVNASFPGWAAEPLLHALEARGVYVSTGSACASRKRERSPALQAMGLPRERVDSALRFSLSHETSAEEIEGALRALAGALEELKGSDAQVDPHEGSGTRS